MINLETWKPYTRRPQGSSLRCHYVGIRAVLTGLDLSSAFLGESLCVPRRLILLRVPRRLSLLRVPAVNPSLCSSAVNPPRVPAVKEPQPAIHRLISSPTRKKGLSKYTWLFSLKLYSSKMLRLALGDRENP